MADKAPKDHETRGNDKEQTLEEQLRRLRAILTEGVNAPPEDAEQKPERKRK